jgi:flavin reductase (DIM6/NTAB) family NADH-FMN oxidoreductase RutF
MDPQAKKTALRMIPYGLYILTAQNGDEIAAGTVNWVTQTAFNPPLVAVGVKTDSGAYGLIRKSNRFALNALGKDQGGVAFGFFKPTQREGNTLNGEPFHAGSTGQPVLDNAVAAIECEVRQVVELGDHHTFVAEVVDAVVQKPFEGRADAATLVMADLGENIFYGG